MYGTMHRLGVVVMSKITRVIGREILDSRGNPTVEVDVWVGALLGRAAVPSGASTGTHEALELRDNLKPFGGKGVSKAVDNINTKIAPKLLGRDVRAQTELDKLMIELDGTPNKSNLGANAILGCSLAIIRTSAKVQNLSLYDAIGKLAGTKPNILPVPFSNVINGGKHAGNNLDIQEYMIAPIGAKSFKESVQMVSETYQALKKILNKKFGAIATNVGDEGGFAPPLSAPAEPCEVLVQAIEEVGYGKKIKLAVDCAATEFYENDKYTLNETKYSSDELIDFYKNLIKTYPVISIEDPLSEDDWPGYSKFTKEVGDKLQIIGDDLFVTNISRLQEGFRKGACNCLLLKVNQIGTLTEALNAAKLAFDTKYGVMVSHRSGETEDSFIADLSVGLNSGQIKPGAPARSDRLAKYNQLIRIEEELGSKCKYAGANFRKAK